MLPSEPDVIAYDEDMGVIFQWSGCPEAETIADLPSNGLARVAIETAHLIRRRDGLVLKGDPPDEYGNEIKPDEVSARPQPVRLKRVDLIPPAEELVEHEPLDNVGLMRVALWKALMWLEEESLLIEDKDIVKALTYGSISIENSNDGAVVFRAHLGRLDVIKVADEAPKPRKRAAKKAEGTVGGA